MKRFTDYMDDLADYMEEVHEAAAFGERIPEVLLLAAVFLLPWAIGVFVILTAPIRWMAGVQ